MFSAGTVNILIDRPSEEHTSLIVQEVPALPPLSLQAARRTMAEWGGSQCKKEEFNNIHLFSAGVPRLLEAAFQTWGELASTAQVALNAMSQQFRSSYADAAPYFRQPEVALALVLCSAVRARNLTEVVRHFQGRSSISKQQVCAGSTAVVV